MTKNDLIDNVAENVGLTKKTSRETVEYILEIIKKTLSSGNKVVLTGFGTFTVRPRKSRKGVNPQTKQGITIAGRNLPGFTAGKDFKKQVNPKSK
ncbi:MAG: HU family DNA-binding protein [bacterium]|nr:HU family DNA-binding protein [bacterium]